MLTRFPDGIEGKSFYQKDAPDFTPDWIRTVPIWSEDTQRTLNYFVCDNLETLLYVANMGSIPLHIWASRADSLELPDWCIIDLDPKGAPFTDVVEVALSLHRLCERSEAAPFRQDQRIDRAPRAHPTGAAVHLRSVPRPWASCWPAWWWRSCRRSRPSCGRSRGERARCISTICRTGTGSSSWRPSASVPCRARRCRCRSNGGR